LHGIKFGLLQLTADAKNKKAIVTVFETGTHWMCLVLEFANGRGDSADFSTMGISTFHVQCPVTGRK
jgi:hypothetical protein